MFADHKLLTAVGAIGVLIVLGHAVLGPDVVPVGVALPGVALLVFAGALFALARRRRDRTGEASRDRP